MTRPSNRQKLSDPLKCEIFDGLLWALAKSAIERLRAAALEVIEFNRQHANDQYGDADRCETWACVRTLRTALGTHRKDLPWKT